MISQAQQAAIANAYGFEDQFEAAFASLITNAGIQGVTPKSVTQFQQTRPRAEVVFKPGGAVPRGTPGQRYININGVIRDAAYVGELAVTVITNSSEDDKLAHRSFVATIRFLMPRSPLDLNGAALVNHTLNFITETGTGLTFKNQDGYWQTSIGFACQFSIQSVALNALAA